MKHMTSRLAIALMLTSIAAQAAPPTQEIWVYTSIYKQFIAPIQAAFEKLHPDVEVQVFQGGSEKIQAKIEAELMAGKPQADVLLTSDPFWTLSLEKRGLLAMRPGHPASETNYYSLMVLISQKSVPAADRPKSFADLTDPRFKNQVQMGSPLESGTSFTTTAYLARKYGWDYFKKLRANGLASSGGNSTVIEKVESGEKKFGVVLLENALASRKRGSPIDIIYPSDGSIPIPSVQVVLKDTKQPAAADEFADFVLSRAGQQFIRAGYMYSVRKDVAPPAGADSLAKVTKASTEWTPALLEEVGRDAKSIKRKFSEIVLE